MGHNTYQGGGTLLRFSPKAKDAMREIGPNRKEGLAAIKRARRRRQDKVVKRIDQMNDSDAQRLERRRREKIPDWR